MKTLTEKLKENIREVQDFPKEGISFKDITSLLLNAQLSGEIIDELHRTSAELKPDYIAGIESRGFLFGMPIAQKLDIPFIPIRKKGKLPGDTYQASYELEYGSAIVELHKGDIAPGSRVLIHDDLLATGGTAMAASDLITQASATVVGFSFLIELEFLAARATLLRQAEVQSLIRY